MRLDTRRLIPRHCVLYLAESIKPDEAAFLNELSITDRHWRMAFQLIEIGRPYRSIYSNLFSIFSNQIRGAV